MLGFSTAKKNLAIQNPPVFDRNFLLEEDSLQAINKHLSSAPVDSKSQYLFENYFYDRYKQILVSISKSETPPEEQVNGENLTASQMNNHLRSSASFQSNDSNGAIAASKISYPPATAKALHPDIQSESMTL